MIDSSGFQNLVEAYGADARRWPAERRAEAEAFMAATPEAAAALARESDLDEALDALRPPTPSAQLRERVLAGAPKAQAAGWSLVSDWLKPGVGALLAVSCIAGVLAGLLLVAPPERPETGADVVAALAAPSDGVGADEDGEVS